MFCQSTQVIPKEGQGSKLSPRPWLGGQEAPHPTIITYLNSNLANYLQPLPVLLDASPPPPLPSSPTVLPEHDTSLPVLGLN